MRFNQIAYIVLVLAALAFASGSTTACGTEKQGHCASTTQKTGDEATASCCTKSDEGNTSCCSDEAAPTCAAQHPGQPCNESGDGNCCGKCHCPHGCTSGSAVCTINIPHHDFAAPPSGDLQSRRQAFYFADHLPEAVYLPIWQPPQIPA